jgi:arsenate reductase
MPHEAEPVTIFHNPDCGTSRKVLEAIRAMGVEPRVVRYLQVGWTRASLGQVLDALGLKPRDVLRTRSGAGQALAEADDAAIFAAMLADPSLVERPIVLTAKGAALCRPADRLDAIL